MKSSRWLGVIVVLQGLILLGQWTGGPRISTVHAQVTDPGAQRLAIVEELRKTNSRLDRIIDLLESGKLQVSVPLPDEKKEPRR
ncbi:MAG: hypothetical protein NZ561_06065 [Phycisphaerae bacterium]|nr:hypothetical protein [Phycisphaerae bacterium]MDW8260919.1 hypothetical protein [Phycisphaerales bacterium]